MHFFPPSKQTKAFTTKGNHLQYGVYDVYSGGRKWLSPSQRLIAHWLTHSGQPRVTFHREKHPRAVHWAFTVLLLFFPKTYFYFTCMSVYLAYMYVYHVHV